jgi:hypothetical protein
MFSQKSQQLELSGRPARKIGTLRGQAQNRG